MLECCKSNNNAFTFSITLIKVRFTNGMGSINISINIPSAYFFEHTHNIFKNILASFFLLDRYPKNPQTNSSIYCLSTSTSLWILRFTCFNDVTCCWSIYLSEFIIASIFFLYFFSSNIVLKFSINTAHTSRTRFDDLWLGFKLLVNVFLQFIKILLHSACYHSKETSLIN